MAVILFFSAYEFYCKNHFLEYGEVDYTNFALPRLCGGVDTMEFEHNDEIETLVVDVGLEFLEKSYIIARKIASIPSIECTNSPFIGHNQKNRTCLNYFVSYNRKKEHSMIYNISNEIDFYYNLEKLTQTNDVFIYCVDVVFNDNNGYVLKLFVIPRSKKL